MASWKARSVLLWLVLGLVVASSIVGVGYSLVQSAREEASGVNEWGETPDVIREWCDNVTSQLGASHPFRTFDELTAAARRGELAEPTVRPESSDPVATDRWQGEHAAFVTSSYFEGLRGFPKKTAIAEGLLKAGIEDAHAGRTAALTASFVQAGQELDEYVAASC